MTDEIRMFCRMTSCRREYICSYFGYEVDRTLSPADHNCCDICEKDCNCVSCRPEEAVVERRSSPVITEAASPTSVRKLVIQDHDDMLAEIFGTTSDLEDRSIASSTETIRSALQTYFAAECASQPMGFISCHLNESTIEHILNSLSDVKDMDSLKVVCPQLDDHYLDNIFAIIHQALDI